MTNLKSKKKDSKKKRNRLRGNKALLIITHKYNTTLDLNWSHLLAKKTIENEMRLEKWTKMKIYYIKLSKLTCFVVKWNIYSFIFTFVMTWIEKASFLYKHKIK